MADYRIVCTRQEPANAPASHQHIVQVGVVPWVEGPVPRPLQMMTVTDVVTREQQGDRFWTWSTAAKRAARVGPIRCHTCNTFQTLRSAPDAIADNNLDNLARCN